MGIVSVLVDSREPAWVQQLTFGGVPTIVNALPAGDVWVACDDDSMLCIERKTSSDLLNTLRDDRLFAQCTALRQASAWAYLLVTGPLLRTENGKIITDRVTGWDWNAVQGALLTVQELGVHVVFAAGDMDLEPAILRLANQERKALAIAPPRMSRVLSDGEAIIASLPGIGTEKLDAILNEFGSMEHNGWTALITLTNEKHGAKLVGPATVRRIRRALGLPEGVALSIEEEDGNGRQ